MIKLPVVTRHELITNSIPIRESGTNCYDLSRDHHSVRCMAVLLELAIEITAKSKKLFHFL